MNESECVEVARHLIGQGIFVVKCKKLFFTWILVIRY